VVAAVIPSSTSTLLVYESLGTYLPPPSPPQTRRNVELGAHYTMITEQQVSLSKHHDFTQVRLESSESTMQLFHPFWQVDIAKEIYIYIYIYISLFMSDAPS